MERSYYEQPSQPLSSHTQLLVCFKYPNVHISTAHISLGLFLMFEATGLRDLEVEYGEYCSSNTDKYGLCLLIIKPTSDLVSPCLYYGLDDFNANHRTFVKSRSWK